MKVLLSCVIAFLASVYWFYPQQAFLSESAESFDELVPALMEEAAIPGLAIAKIENGEVAHISTYGMADINAGRPVTPETLFNIASVSKPIMGLALLQLADQNKVSLDIDINEYLSVKVDNPHLKDERITLRHLASHSSGLNDFYAPQSFTANMDSPVSLREHLFSLLTPDGDRYNEGQYYLQTLPGESRKYSNLGAGLAGQIVEDVTGQTLAEYSKTKLFSRLNMPATRWLLSDLDLADIAVPYEVEQCIPWLFLCANSEQVELNYLINKYIAPPVRYKQLVPYPHFGNPQYPDGGIRTSIVELSRFVVAVLSNSDGAGRPLLSDAMHEEMFSLQLAPEVSDSQRFFWRDRHHLTGHMGSDLGTFASVYFDLQSKTGFVILMNRGMDGRSAKAMQTMAEYLMSTTYSAKSTSETASK